MTFKYIAGLWGLMGIPILILIYVLRRRYREETVSSTFLWKRSLQYMKRRFPFSLRNSILLLLQILTIVLASLVLARPSIISWKTGEVIAIVDGSASMMSKDHHGVSRFDRALEKIEELAEDADENHRVTVIVAGDEAKTHVFRATTYYDITRGLSGLSCSYSDADIEGALNLALEAQKNNTEAEIRFYTDKTYEYTNGVSIVDMTDNEWNVAAVNLDALEKSGIWEFTGEVASYGDDINVNASLYVDGEHVSSKKVVCKDGEITKVEFRDYNAYNFQYAQMFVKLVDGDEDALAEDNSFTYYNNSQQRKKIQVAYGPKMKDQFLDSALRSIKNVTVSSAQAEGIDEQGYEKLYDEKGNPIESNIKSTGYDLYVYVGILPREIPSDGAIWILNPPQVENLEGGSNTIVPMPEEIPLTFEHVRTYPISEGSTKTNGYSVVPYPHADERYSMLSKGLSLQNVKVGSYAPIVLGEDSSFVPLMYCDEEDVILAGSIQDNFCRVLVMSISTSNLSTQMADYILLMTNMVSFSCPDYINNSVYEIGDPAILHMPSGAKDITIKWFQEAENEDDKSEWITLNVVDAQNLSYTFTKPGNYTFEIGLERKVEGVIDDTQTQTLQCFARIAETDSNIYGVEASLEAFPVPDGITTEFEPVEIWQYLLILLFIILTAEWWVYYRA